MKSRNKFDPFNITSQSEPGKIKFERLGQSVKPRSIWWLAVLFVLVYLIYKYLVSATV